MKFSQFVHNIDKIILNEKKFIMTSYFHNAVPFLFFQILSTLAPYSDLGFDFYYSKSYAFQHQNIKTELENLLYVQKIQLKVIYFYNFSFNFWIL